MATPQDYYNKSTDERIILKQLIPLLYDGEQYDIQYYMTDIESNEVYDCFLTVYKKETGQVLKRHIIEIKVRDTHYEDLLLEKEKLSNLKKKVKKMELTTDKEDDFYYAYGCDIIYISTTPKGSYIYNLSKLERNNKIEWSKEEHWISTTDKVRGKKMKLVTYLPTDQSYFRDVKQTDLVKLKYQMKEDEKIKKECIKHKQTKCLFMVLLYGEEYYSRKNKEQ